MQLNGQKRLSDLFKRFKRVSFKAVFSVSVGFWGYQTPFKGFRTPSEPPVPRVKNKFVRLLPPKSFF